MITQITKQNADLTQLVIILLAKVLKLPKIEDHFRPKSIILTLLLIVNNSNKEVLLAQNHNFIIVLILQLTANYKNRFNI